MNHITNNTTNYLNTLEDIKQRVKTAQIKAHFSVNREMLILYWQIGSIILHRQEKEGWGSKIIDRLSQDLKQEFSTLVTHATSRVIGETIDNKHQQTIIDKILNDELLSKEK